MATFQRIFVVATAAETHKLFQATILQARATDRIRRRAGLGRAAATEKLLLLSYGEWQIGMDRLAIATAANARRAMRARLRATAKRPGTGVRPHLSEVLNARSLSKQGPFSTGMVGIADEEILNRAVNPLSGGRYGPYWRAQEFGTGSPEVPSQIGRILYGFFFGPGLSGAPTPPLAQYKGGGGPHPIFVSAASQKTLNAQLGFGGRGAGPRGGFGGRGTIDYEIEARHFIRDGADQAYRDWIAGVKTLETEAIRDLQKALVGVPRGPGGRFIRRRP